MSSRPAVALALALSLASSLVAGPSSAQSAADVAAARELFVEASELARQGSWVAARDRYERSLALKRAPITLYSLGVAQQQTGKLVEALESFRAFLVEPSAPATKPYEAPAKQAIAELETRVARLDVKLSPADVPGVEVRIDGELLPRAALDRSRLVNPGRHEITASAPGYNELRRSASPTAGGRAVVVLKLQRDPKQPAPTTPARGASPVAATPAAVESPAAGATAPASRALPIALVAGGAATLVAGATIGLLGVANAGDAPTSDGPDADAARTQAIAGDVVGGVGIVAAGVGLVLLLWPRDADPPVAQRPASAFIGPGRAGLLVRF